MSKYSVPLLETERLILRGLKKEDAEAMYDYASNIDVASFTSFQPHTSLDETKHIIETVFLSRPQKNWPEAFALVDKKTKKMIGTCDFWPVMGNDCFEMGYVLHKDYWHQGLMTEAVQGVLRFAFEEYGVRRMSIRHKSNNARSQRVIEKIGFIYEGMHQAVFIENAEVVDMKYYRLLKEEYHGKRIR
ncbi:GNAT family N-acetyltransferase [Erysipelothrix urinaevulpis]|uniref:GNAT family N-acetyltransferase n=1 Tax=Erysipelothrix urinaevulpis TaxID=2683717 RepID=UPI00135B2687|nr:GNAT family N-acetyltransferase [Erysipelothrix urinaevulpis]